MVRIVTDTLLAAKEAKPDPERLGFEVPQVLRLFVRLRPADISRKFSKVQKNRRFFPPFETLPKTPRVGFTFYRNQGLDQTAACSQSSGRLPVCHGSILCFLSETFQSIAPSSGRIKPINIVANVDLPDKLRPDKLRPDKGRGQSESGHTEAPATAGSLQ